MSSRRRRKRRKSRKRLVYGVIAVAFIFICVVTYSYLNPSNQTPTDGNSPDQLPLETAIVDQLSFKNDTANPAFVNVSKNILEEANFAVDYYRGEKVDVNFYKSLFTSDYSLIVLRVHSAMIGNTTDLGLFTSEREDESKYNTTSAPYYDDVKNNRTVRAYFLDDPTPYFAIAPGFIEKYGTFQNTIVIMMGCDGLKYSMMAEAFKTRGAKVCIGWNGLVSAPHTDNATTCLLQHLAQGDTVGETVDKTMYEVGPDKEYGSVLRYYPENSGSYTIQFTLSIYSMDIIRADTVLAKEDACIHKLFRSK